MGMNVYNRAHPYVKHMEDEYSKVQLLLVKNMSNMIRFSIIATLMSIISSLLLCSIYPFLTNVIIVLILCYLHIILIRDDSIIQANQYINGSDYQVVNINEKNITDAIKSLYLQEGKLVQFDTLLNITTKVLYSINTIVILYQLVQLCIPYLTH